MKKLNLDALIIDNTDNSSLSDEELLNKLLGKKNVFDEIESDDPELDKPQFILKTIKVDSRTEIRSFEPYKPWVCDYCGFNYFNDYALGKPIPQNDRYDISNITPEIEEKIKPVVDRMINAHISKMHRGIAPKQIITKRQALTSAKFSLKF